MASISRRKGKGGKDTWRAHIRRKGHAALDRSFDTEEEATQWAEITESSLMNPYQLRATANMMFDRYTDEILPQKSKECQKSERYHIGFWKDKLGKKFLDEITPAEVEILADSLYERMSRVTKQPLTSESRRKFLMTLSYIFNTAAKEWRWCQYNPLSLVKKHQESKKKDKPSTESINNECPLRKGFLDEIRKEMEKRGLSQGGLAHLMKIAKSTIQSLFDPKKNLTLRTMTKVCHALDKELEMKVYDKKN